MMSHFFLSTRRCRQTFPGFLLVVSAAFPVVSSTPDALAPLHQVGAATEIRIEIHDRSDLQRLTRLVGIDDVRGTRVLASATPAQLAALRAAGFRWEVVPTAAKVDATMCPDGWEEDDERSWSCYPTYGQYTAMMNRCAALHPEICRLVDLGPTANTVRPHRLLAVIISDNPDVEEDEPEVLLTSTIHGDETTGYVLTLRLIDHLIASYDSDVDITDLIDSTEIWINPLANPDGTYSGGDATVAGAIRNYTTSNGGDSGVNGNRNFPDPQGGNHPDDRPWWPETEAMMALAAAGDLCPVRQLSRRRRGRQLPVGHLAAAAPRQRLVHRSLARLGRPRPDRRPRRLYDERHQQRHHQRLGLVRGQGRTAGLHDLLSRRPRGHHRAFQHQTAAG